MNVGGCHSQEPMVLPLTAATEVRNLTIQTNLCLDLLITTSVFNV